MKDPGVYALVQESSSSDLMDSVNVLMRDGWQPLGGAACFSNGDRGVVFAQAMFKERVLHYTGKK